MLFHIKQHGANIDIKYNLVDSFIKNNEPLSIISDMTISNQERKSLKRDLDPKILDYFEYSV